MTDFWVFCRDPSFPRRSRLGWGGVFAIYLIDSFFVASAPISVERAAEATAGGRSDAHGEQHRQSIGDERSHRHPRHVNASRTSGRARRRLRLATGQVRWHFREVWCPRRSMYSPTRLPTKSSWPATARWGHSRFVNYALTKLPRSSSAVAGAASAQVFVSSPAGASFASKTEVS